MGRQAESLTMNGGDPFRLQNITAEIKVSFNDCAIRSFFADQPGNGRIDIEGALRPGTDNTVNFTELFHNHIPSSLEDLRPFRQEILGACQGLNGRGL